MIFAARQMLSEDRPGAGASTNPRARAVRADPTMRRAVEAVTTERLNVLVVGHDQHLDRWGRQLAVALRARTDIQLEIYIPASAESLVSRFNQSLASLTLEAARGDVASELAAKVLLVPDIRSLDTPEGMLLCRLVSDFPGANARLVVLGDREGLHRCSRVLEALGRRLRRIELEGREDSSAARHPESPVSPAQRTEATSTENDAQSVTQPVRATAAVEIDASNQPLSSAPRGRPSWVTWLSVALALMLISVLVVVLLHRDRGTGSPVPVGGTSSRSEKSPSVPVAAQLATPTETVPGVKR